MNIVGLTNQSIASQADVSAIRVVTDQLLLYSSTEGTLTGSAAEQDIYINNAPIGAWAPHVVYIDLDNMLGVDTTFIKVYYRVINGGGMQLFDVLSYVGVDGGLAGSRKIIAITLVPNRNGVQVTLQQTTGICRDYDWNVIVES